MRTTTMLAIDSEPIDASDPAVMAVRAMQTNRRLMRDQLMQLDDGRVRVAFRIHLLEPEVEHLLSQRLASSEDRLALIRHCQDPGDGSTRDAANVARQDRDRTLEALSAAIVADDVTLAGLRPAAADWALADVSLPMIEQAHRIGGALRAELVAAVDTVIDADLLRVRSPRRAIADDIAELELLEHDDEAIGRVRAFAEQVAEARRVAVSLSERMRLAALAGTRDQPREWLLQSAVRRRRARHSLDSARATQAAIADLHRFSDDASARWP